VDACADATQALRLNRFWTFIARGAAVVRLVQRGSCALRRIRADQRDAVCCADSDPPAGAPSYVPPSRASNRGIAFAARRLRPRRLKSRLAG